MIHRIQDNSFTSGGQAGVWERVDVDTISTCNLMISSMNLISFCFITYLCNIVFYMQPILPF